MTISSNGISQCFRNRTKIETIENNCVSVSAGEGGLDHSDVDCYFIDDHIFLMIDF